MAVRALPQSQSKINLFSNNRVSFLFVRFAGADVYLLDDPLSAVDAHVGRHLFTACICGLLKGSTRVLVTHQMHFLSDSNVDQILVIQDGQIVKSGTYADLIAQGVDFHQYEYTEAASTVRP
jgi:ABC-type multidrug transport system fused ATPase/permease subunit